ncbi:hypothetical protein L484_024303 [Morus notabilis]|uniref:Uncharacterized protein n=1 Tax=Morus notabilis TaxID=981085 RepID=W9QH74_9ROSA|nr:hypothetical protein L484_024303 [Morus notabilis]
MIWNHDSSAGSVLDLLFTANDLHRVDEGSLPDLVVSSHHREILSPYDATSGLHLDLCSEN